MFKIVVFKGRYCAKGRNEGVFVIVVQGCGDTQLFLRNRVAETQTVAMQRLPPYDGAFLAVKGIPRKREADGGKMGSHPWGCKELDTTE